MSICSRYRKRKPPWRAASASPTKVYTQYLNRKLHQSGGVWKNRFFSCVVENEQYLWAVARYIERNPLKVGLAESAEAYCWSSAKAHLTGIWRRSPESNVLARPFGECLLFRVCTGRKRRNG